MKGLASLDYAVIIVYLLATGIFGSSCNLFQPGGKLCRSSWPIKRCKLQSNVHTVLLLQKRNVRFLYLTFRAFFALHNFTTMLPERSKNLILPFYDILLAWLK